MIIKGKNFPKVLEKISGQMHILFSEGMTTDNDNRELFLTRLGSHCHLGMREGVRSALPIHEESVSKGEEGFC